MLHGAFAALVYCLCAKCNQLYYNCWRLEQKEQVFKRQEKNQNYRFKPNFLADKTITRRVRRGDSISSCNFSEFLFFSRPFMFRFIFLVAKFSFPSLLGNLNRDLYFLLQIFCILSSHFSYLQIQRKYQTELSYKDIEFFKDVKLSESFFLCYLTV